MLIINSNNIVIISAGTPADSRRVAGRTVLHCGQSPCSQCIEGQTMAHFGGSHFWAGGVEAAAREARSKVTRL